MTKASKTKISERVTYYNGRIIPESEVAISFRDRGFKYGDAVFDMTRTFNHKIFKLEEHIKRFYNSLRYVQIDPQMTESQMVTKSEEVFEANRHLLGQDDDFWLGQRVSRGIDLVGGEMWDTDGSPTTIIECTPLPLKPRAKLYRDGISVVVPSVRRVPPESLSPRAKSHNYLNLIMADLEAKVQDPEGWAILLDNRGFLTEGIGSNIFTIKNEVIYTPKEQYVLGGISRETAIELANGLGLSVVEKDIDIFDAYTADEIFLTSTSLCICGVSNIQGRQMPHEGPSGPITKALMNAYVDLVEYDWIGQYLKQLED
jgi:branched-chain amino acid aminotransferase|tara:strand:- start:4676 stop:5620 length:945 start_codon:yes stop_codon:yes gene_type:complete